MIRIALLAVLSALTSTAALAQDPDISARLRAYFEPLEASRDFSGVIAVRRGDELISYERFGYANWETGTQFTPQTAFPVGSVTKSLTAGLIIRMSGEGQLNLDAPVRQYIPDLDPAFTASVFDVLMHRSGLPRDFSPGALTDNRSHTVIQWLNDTHAFEPGPHDESYSNVGYSLLAIVAERAGHGRFETLVTMELLSPLGMTSSRLSRERRELDVTGYAPGPLPLDLRAPMVDEPGFGAGGLITTVDDLMRLATAVASRELDLFQPDGSLIGSFSVRTLGEEVIYTIQGSVPGYSGGVSIIPARELVIAYSTNIESYSNWGIRDVLHRLVLDEAVIPAAVRQPTYELADSHRALIGTYESTGFGPVEISEAEDGLAFTLLERGWSFYLTPQPDGAVLWRTFNIHLAPTRDETGLLTALTATQRMIGQQTEISRWARDMPPMPETETAED
ncbi:serine hydrolase domain-containing protein [Maricaulis sp. MIT060901]|uniref:serine hydrolase domain-containing protein n=1 Tax=Maricaulis sp. MIT060901 TaxID=3096993 RepID=UPI00399B56E8